MSSSLTTAELTLTAPHRDDRALSGRPLGTVFSAFHANVAWTVFPARTGSPRGAHGPARW